jgi:hypothetical protein
MASGVSEVVCVAAPSPAGAIDAAQRAAPPRELSRIRGDLAARRPTGPIAVETLLAYLPPAPTNAAFEVRAASAVDPLDPTHGWVVVEAVAALGQSELPLRLTVMLSLAESMGSAPTSDLPMLQDSGPGDVRTTTRIQLAKSILDELVRRMPARTEIALVVFDRTSGRVALPPTSATERERIREVIERMKPLGSEASASALDAAYKLAGADYDPCADQRMLLLTDGRALLSPNPQKTLNTVESWGKKGLELWTVSLGLLGQTAPEVEALAVAGRGTHLYADTKSEAVEPLVAALRATGAVVREPKLEVSFGPAVTSWTPVGGAAGTGSSDTFPLPVTIEGGWREVRVYDVRLNPDVAGPLGAVTWSAGSPVPGEWTLGETVELPADALSTDSADFLKRRVFAMELAAASAQAHPEWLKLRLLGTSLQLGNGPARELLVWTDLLAKAAGP